MKRIKILSLFLILSMLIASIVILNPLRSVRATTIWLPYFSAEPVMTGDVNASINGLQTQATPPGPSPVGQNFTVEIHLRNATITNIPNGTLSVEADVNFASILSYATPIGFVDMLGQNTTGGVLNGPIHEASTGFYNSTGGRCNLPYNGTIMPYYDGVLPYNGPVEFDIDGAGEGPQWYGLDGIVCIINFTITGQPSTALGQSEFYAPILIVYTDMYTIKELPPGSGNWAIAEQANYDVQGTLDIGTCSGIHDITVTNVTPNKFSVGQGYGFNATITLTNVGAYTEIFDRVTVYMNKTLPVSATYYFGAWNQSVTIASGNYANITIIGNMANITVPYNNYTLWIYAPSYGEPNGNNMGRFDNMTITVIGDVTGDFKDNLSDLGKLAKAYNAKPTSANWNANCDIDNNGVVNLSDLGLLAKHYNQKVNPQ